MDLSPRFSKMENYDVNKWQVWIREAFLGRISASPGGHGWMALSAKHTKLIILCLHGKKLIYHVINYAKMIVVRVNIRFRSPPSWNSVFGTMWLRISSRPRFRTRARNPVGPRRLAYPRPGPNHKVQGLKPYNFAPNHTIFQWNHTILCQTIQFPDHVKIRKIYASIHFEQELRI